MTSKTRLLALLLGGIALICIILALQLIAPGAKTLHETVGTATIDFSADRRMVALPGGCVTVKWHVEHIQDVYINRTPTVGDGQKDVCVDRATMPALRVKFEDGTKRTYTLTIGFLAEQPSTWLLLVAAVVLALTSLLVAFSRSAQPIPVSAEVGHTPRATALLARFALVLIGLFVVLVVLELVLRFYFSNYGSESDKIDYLYSRTEIAKRHADMSPLPFVEYGLSLDTVGHNSLGYRGDEIQVPKPAGVYRIAALGDSTTYGVFSSYDQAYPAYLQQVLRSDYGYSQVEVVNGGVLGYASWNTLVNLELRVAALQPDLVIVYEGGNDVIPREVSPKCYSAPSQYLGLDPRRQLWAQSAELSPSALYRVLALHFGWVQGPGQSTSYSATTSNNCSIPTDAKTAAANVAANPPIYFERNERDMSAIARANGFRIMFSTWAYNPNAADALDFWRAAVAEHNTITARVAQETGALFLDYAAVAPTDKQFWIGSMHMNPQGNLIQAQIFAKFLVDQGVIPKPGSGG